MAEEDEDAITGDADLIRSSREKVKQQTLSATNLKDLKKLKRVKALEKFPDTYFELNRHQETKIRERKMFSDEDQDELLNQAAGFRITEEDKWDLAEEDEKFKEIEEFAKAKDQLGGMKVLLEKLNVR